jgi:hypothetical protein
MSVLFDAQDRRQSGWAIQGVEGVHPAVVDWATLRKLEAKRPLDGGREQIFIVPLSDDVHHILIDDCDAQKLARMRADGFHPAAVIESSPGNYQVILNVPHQTNDSRLNIEVENFLTHRLNWQDVSFYEAKLAQLVVEGASEKRLRTAHQHLEHAIGFGGGLGLGDSQLYGSRHPHRLPGFHNQKTKHRLTDGSYPLVTVVTAEGGMCPATLALAQDALRRERVRVERRERHDAGIVATPAQVKRKRNVPTMERESAASSLMAIWAAHRREILRIQAGSSEYQVDIMVAQRLRATGHLVADIEIAVAGCSSARYTNNTYPRRVVDKAFNPESDAVLASTARYHVTWQALEQRALTQIERKANRQRKVEAYQQNILSLMK